MHCKNDPAAANLEKNCQRSVLIRSCPGKGQKPKDKFTRRGVSQHWSLPGQFPDNQEEMDCAWYDLPILTGMRCPLWDAATLL